MGHEGEVFWAAFSHLGFGPVGAPGDEVAGDEFEHLVVEFCPCPGAGGVDGGGKVSHGVEGAFVADAVEGHVVPVGALLHDAPGEVVGDGVHAEFLLYHRRAFAAQDVGSDADFDFAKANSSTADSESNERPNSSG